MVGFGERIAAEQQESPWASSYLNYAKLKRIVEEHTDDETALRMASQPSTASLGALSLASRETLVSTKLGSTGGNLHPATKEFLFHLQIEVEKIVLFVLQEQGRIAHELAACREDIRRIEERVHQDLILASTKPLPTIPSDEHNNDHRQLHPIGSEWLIPVGGGEEEEEERPPPHVEVHIDAKVVNRVEKDLSEAGLHLLNLYRFTDVNIIGIRKILKKHDKILKHHRLSPTFLAVDRDNRNTPAGIGFLRGPRRLTAEEYGNTLVMPLLQHDGLGALTVTLEAGLLELQSLRQNHLLRSTSSSPQLNSPLSHRRRIHSVPNDLREAASTQQTKDANYVLLQIRAAEQRLHQTGNFIRMLAAHMIVEDGTPSADGGYDKEEYHRDESQRPSSISNLLNLLSTFNFMTNYYIVAPTSATYAQKLGGNASLASIIIGMTPVAALVSTVLYSYWTSYSYRSALIFASTCSLIGNLFYAAGLPYNSLTLVMIGRLLNGFGSARSINRRYIADAFSRSERTAASAVFVTFGALGMAAGPFIASLLHLVTTNTQGDSLFETPYWQAENAPGWFMFVAWSVYLVFLLRNFTDPPRQKQAPAESIEMNETKPLLAVNGNGTHESSVKTHVQEPPIWRNIAVMTTFFVYFVLKLFLESVLSSTATLTDFYFDWQGGIVGMYLAVLGLLLLPANLAVAYLARSYDDRELIMGMLFLMFVGCLAVLQYTSTYTLSQYLVGSVILFVSATSLEGPNMSLLSKTIPKSWSRGVFNVGMLATESGTMGRAVGDVLLALFGSAGIEHLLNRTFGSFAVLSFTTLLGSLCFYDYLEPTEKED